MKKIILIFLITSFIVNVIPYKLNAATTYGGLLDELAELEAQKEAKENEKLISEAEYQKTSQKIIETQNKINDLNDKIIEATNKIAELEEEIKNKKEETKNILRFLQVSNGEQSYLEYVFKATSFTDFIHRVSIVEQLSSYNKKLINEMNALIKETEELKEKLANDVKKAEAERKTLQENLKKINARINDLDDEGATLEDQIESVKKQIEYYDELGCNNREDNLVSCLARISNQETDALYEMLGATQFLRPIPRGIVTSWFGYRDNPLGKGTSYHSGVDISDKSPAEGQPIYASASGIVAQTVTWTCGGKTVLIYHRINGHDYTSVYMHLLDISVEVGQVVTANDIVGHMGGYSTSSKHGGYDDCTTGAHIHLTICDGHVNAADYRSYLLDPTKFINLPYGWFYSRLG